MDLNDRDELMQHRQVRFFSERLMLHGTLYYPQGSYKRPAIIACSGYMGLQNIQPARFARLLTGSEYVCFTFDYRGFGQNEGERGRLAPQDQIEDVRSAVSYVMELPEVDPEQIILLGWGLGGSIAIAEAADDPYIQAVISINGLANGYRVIERMHSDDQEFMAHLQKQILDDRARRAIGSRSLLADPFATYTLDDVTKDYVRDQLYQYPGFGSEVTLESIDKLLRFLPEHVVEQIHSPTLFVHGAENKLHLPEESQVLYKAANEPKEMVILEGVGHTEWMFDDHATFLHVIDIVRDFLHTNFAHPAELNGNGNVHATQNLVHNPQDHGKYQIRVKS